MFLYGESRETMMHVAGMLPFTPAPGTKPDHLRDLMDEIRESPIHAPWNLALKSPDSLRSPLQSWVEVDEVDPCASCAGPDARCRTLTLVAVAHRQHDGGTRLREAARDLDADAITRAGDDSSHAAEVGKADLPTRRAQRIHGRSSRKGQRVGGAAWSYGSGPRKAEKGRRISPGLTNLDP